MNGMGHLRPRASRHIGTKVFAGAAYSPDGTRLATGAYDYIKVWDADLDRHSSERRLAAAHNGVDPRLAQGDEHVLVPIGHFISTDRARHGERQHQEQQAGQAQRVGLYDDQIEAPSRSIDMIALGPRGSLRICRDSASQSPASMSRTTRTGGLRRSCGGNGFQLFLLLSKSPATRNGRSPRQPGSLPKRKSAGSWLP